MNNSTRENVLLMLFPSVMIILLWFGWFRPTQQEAAAANGLAAARKSAPELITLTAARLETKKVQDQQIAEETRKKDLEAQWRRLQISYAGQRETADTINQIAALFRRHDLKWIDGKVLREGAENQTGKLYSQTMTKLQGPPPAGKTAIPTGQIDYSQQANSALTTSKLPLPQTVLWKVEFAGNYENVLAALQSLSTTVQHAVPIELRMSPAKPGLRTRLWSLVLAI